MLGLHLSGFIKEQSHNALFDSQTSTFIRQIFSFLFFFDALKVMFLSEHMECKDLFLC